VSSSFDVIYYVILSRLGFSFCQHYTAAIYA